MSAEAVKLVIQPHRLERKWQRLGKVLRSGDCRSPDAIVTKAFWKEKLLTALQSRRALNHPDPNKHKQEFLFPIMTAAADHCLFDPKKGQR